MVRFRWNRARRTVLLGTAVIVAACDPFEVSDPARFTDDDIDQALDAVANGVEGAFQLVLDDYVINTALLGDEWQHTGTWAQYDELDHGRARYSNMGNVDGIMNAWLRARFSAEDALERFTRLAVPDTDAKTIRVKTAAAFIDLYLGEGWCEAPAEQGGPAVTDAQMYAQAITKLTEAFNLAQQASLTEWVRITQAGLARANLLAGNFAAAEAAALQVPDGFEYAALFSEQASSNAVVNLNTVGFNKAAGVREKWWTQVDTIQGLMRDPWTGQLDPRLPVVHLPRDRGVDATTPFYSQYKYKQLGADIPIIDSEEMRLIEAEVAWRRGSAADLAIAMSKMNDLRAAAGLSPLPDPAGNANTVRDYLLHERFAENFMEGRRLADLYRFNLIGTIVIEVGKPSTGRLMKFALSQTEALYNDNIEDDLSKRCAPVS